MANIKSLIRKVVGRSDVDGAWDGVKLIHLDTVGSTNDYIMAYKPDEGEKITVVVADEQTAGRGQGTNKWMSEAGKNLTFSVLVHPTHVPLARQFLLSEAGALALWEVLGGYLGKDDVKMKWPNDIYWRDKKISGTLIETRLGGGHIKDFVFGTGIDVNQREFNGDAPNPVSMYQILGHETDLKEVLDRVIVAFKKYYAAIENGEYAAISELYHSGLYRAHGFYPYRDKDGDFEAAIVEVEDSGHLILRDKAGCIRSYAFKEVSFNSSPSIPKGKDV